MTYSNIDWVSPCPCADDSPLPIDILRVEGVGTAFPCIDLHQLLRNLSAFSGSCIRGIEALAILNVGQSGPETRDAFVDF